MAILSAKAVTGTTGDDDLDTSGSGGDTVDTINGNVGDDTITSGGGNDLNAGDMLGDEWVYTDGRWVYTPKEIDYFFLSLFDPENGNYDDVIRGGLGDDVVLGNLGNDALYGDEGADIVNAGRGLDTAYGGTGDDIVNLEKGDDFGFGGDGADTVNAGSGNDTVYGDNAHVNLLEADASAKNTISMNQYAEAGLWSVSKIGGTTQMSQTVEVSADSTYTVSFEVAANLAGGSTNGEVEVIWNDEIIGTIKVTDGIFQRHEFEISGGATDGTLTLREVPPENSLGNINTDGPVMTYERTITVGDQEIEVAAFVPGQAKLYQVISGRLNIFDPATNSYQSVGEGTGLAVNAIGYNIEDDLLYGQARKDGTDALGNAVSRFDFVVMDAEGQAYKIGTAPMGSYVGDFDQNGNLWTFHGALNQIVRTDVSALMEGATDHSTSFYPPRSMFRDDIYDIAFNATENAFYAVSGPSKNGQSGMVYKIDIDNIDNAGRPQITSLEITHSIYDTGAVEGMPKAAYGAVFLDGDGNLYFGLNRGDHDLDGATKAQGAIFKVHMDWENGAAFSEFMADAESTGNNDGAVDPRSADAFNEVDVEATVLIRQPELIELAGGNDKLRGGTGEDEMHGGAGDDTLNGGADNDVLFGDEGNDRVNGNSGDDLLNGGSGTDKLMGGDGDDRLNGGADRDFVNGGAGHDVLSGDDGNDKMVGGLGEDRLIGGAGRDHMWGGQWTGDGAQDTFVMAAGGGRDMIHDFEFGVDRLDLTSYGIDYDALQNHITDQGWAVEINLAGLSGGHSGDILFIKKDNPVDFGEDHFLF